MLTKLSLEDRLSLQDYHKLCCLYDCNEYKVFLDDFIVGLGVVHSATQSQKIYQLRKTVYQDKMSYLLNSEAGLLTSADKLDASSYIFYCRSGNQILASCRYTPSINGAWETPTITEAADLVPTDKTKMLQVGRLLIAPEYRSQLIAEMIVWASCDWLNRHTEYNSCYAICTPALVRFYRHFGAKSVPKTTVTLPERQNKTYRIVYGSMPNMVKTLEEYLLKKDGLFAYPSQRASTNITA